MTITRFAPAALTAALCASLAATATAQQDRMDDALSAAPTFITDGATVTDWDGTVLREGTNGWTCMPTPPDLPGNAPMCVDATFASLTRAWQSRETPTYDGVGVAYMLAGDAGASNSDPFAMSPEGVDDWVVAGPHLMIVVPDPSVLATFNTDPSRGPWVMWKNTPYTHVMVPVAEE